MQTEEEHTIEIHFDLPIALLAKILECHRLIAGEARIAFRVYKNVIQFASLGSMYCQLAIFYIPIGKSIEDKDSVEGVFCAENKRLKELCRHVNKNAHITLDQFDIAFSVGQYAPYYQRDFSIPIKPYQWDEKTWENHPSNLFEYYYEIRNHPQGLQRVSNVAAKALVLSDEIIKQDREIQFEIRPCGTYISVDDVLLFEHYQDPGTDVDAFDKVHIGCYFARYFEIYQKIHALFPTLSEYQILLPEDGTYYPIFIEDELEFYGTVLGVNYCIAPATKGSIWDNLNKKAEATQNE